MSQDSMAILLLEKPRPYVRPYLTIVTPSNAYAYQSNEWACAIKNDNGNDNHNHNNNDKEEEEEDNDNDDDKEEEEDNDNYDEEEDSDNDDNKDKDNKDQERCVCDPCRCPSLFVRLSESSRLSTSV